MGQSLAGRPTDRADYKPVKADRPESYLAAGDRLAGTNAFPASNERGEGGHTGQACQAGKRVEKENKRKGKGKTQPAQLSGAAVARSLKSTRWIRAPNNPRDGTRLRERDRTFEPSFPGRSSRGVRHPSGYLCDCYASRVASSFVASSAGNTRGLMEDKDASLRSNPADRRYRKTVHDGSAGACVRVRTKVFHFPMRSTKHSEKSPRITSFFLPFL